MVNQMNMKKQWSAIILLYMLIAMPLIAAPADSVHFQPDSVMAGASTDIQQPYSMDIVKVALRALLSLAGIVILIFITILVLKKIVFQQRLSPAFSNAVSVLGTVPIAPKKSIQLVKMVDRVLVIAVTESNVSLLTEIDDTHVLETLGPATQTKNSDGLPFKQYLIKMLGKSNEN